MFRNQELRKEMIVYGIITLVTAVTASFFSPISSLFVVLIGVVLTAVHLF